MVTRRRVCYRCLDLAASVPNARPFGGEAMCSTMEAGLVTAEIMLQVRLGGSVKG